MSTDQENAAAARKLADEFAAFPRVEHCFPSIRVTNTQLDLIIVALRDLAARNTVAGPRERQDDDDHPFCG